MLISILPHSLIRKQQQQPVLILSGSTLLSQVHSSSVCFFSQNFSKSESVFPFPSFGHQYTYLDLSTGKNFLNIDNIHKSLKQLTFFRRAKKEVVALLSSLPSLVFNLPLFPITLFNESTSFLEVSQSSLIILQTLFQLDSIHKITSNDPPNLFVPDVDIINKLQDH